MLNFYAMIQVSYLTSYVSHLKFTTHQPFFFTFFSRSIDMKLKFWCFLSELHAPNYTSVYRTAVGNDGSRLMIGWRWLVRCTDPWPQYMDGGLARCHRKYLGSHFTPVKTFDRHTGFYTCQCIYYILFYYIFIYSFIYLFIYLFVYLFIHLLIYVFIHFHLFSFYFYLFIYLFF